MFLKSKGFASFVIVGSAFTAYLFASAPTPLPEANAQHTAEVSVQRLLEICAAENAEVRSLYTKEIVGEGKLAGLKFAEDWHKPGVDAGPLPALFLRETAKNLERDPVRLGLFLGSDYPISQANLLHGRQAEVFKSIRKDRRARHFFVEDLGVFTAMFPDLAVAPACVSCHNDHPDTPKTDWKLGDVMGATTWTYPKATMPLSEALEVIAALRRGFSAAYEGYVEKAKTFKSPPTIGEQWPTNGYFLPTPQVFMQAAERRTSPGSMRRLLASR